MKRDWQSEEFEVLVTLGESTTAARGGTPPALLPWLVHFDGVHANDLGHLVVAHRIFEKLLQSCSGLSLHTRALERPAPCWRDESTLSADYGHFLLLSAAAEMMNLDAIDRSIESWMWNRGFSDRPGTAGEF